MRPTAPHGPGRGPGRAMRVGEAIEVYSRFDGTWVNGLDLVGTAQDGRGDKALVVRRRSDGFVLPAAFPLADVRSDGSRQTARR